MGIPLYEQLEEIARGLHWIGKLPESTIIMTLAAKFKHFGIEDL